MVKAKIMVFWAVKLLSKRKVKQMGLVVTPMTMRLSNKLATCFLV